MRDSSLHDQPNSDLICGARRPGRNYCEVLRHDDSRVCSGGTTRTEAEKEMDVGNTRDPRPRRFRSPRISAPSSLGTRFHPATSSAIVAPHSSVSVSAPAASSPVLESTWETATKGSTAPVEPGFVLPSLTTSLGFSLSSFWKWNLLTLRFGNPPRPLLELMMQLALSPHSRDRCTAGKVTAS